MFVPLSAMTVVSKKCSPYFSRETMSLLHWKVMWGLPWCLQGLELKLVKILESEKVTTGTLSFKTPLGIKTQPPNESLLDLEVKISTKEHSA